MKNNGQFDVSGNTKVEVSFPCSNCGATVVKQYQIKPESHSDETAACDECDTDYYVTVIHDEGTGTVDVTGISPDDVKAKGIP